jgi:hypothetical protein
MQAWRRAKPLDAQAYTRTPPSMFGLDRNELRQEFQFYSNRFGVADVAT